MKNKILIFFGIILVLTMSFALVSANGADGYCIGATTNFTCGDTVTESCVFNASMDCSGTGFPFGLEIDSGTDITIACNGFDLIGDMVGVGISLLGNDLVVQDCNIKEWFIGVASNDAEFVSSNVNITDNNITDVLIGIYFESVGDSFILENDIVCYELAVEPIGISFELGTFRIPTNNYIEGNNILNCSFGIDIVGDSHTIYQNTITNSDAIGLRLYNVFWANVTELFIDLNGLVGISMNETWESNISYSSVSNASEAGIIMVNDCEENLIEHSNITNVLGEFAIAGIYLYTEEGYETRPISNVIIDNIITDCGHSGIYLFDAPGNFIAGNHITKTRPYHENNTQNGIWISNDSDVNQMVYNQIYNFSIIYEPFVHDRGIYLTDCGGPLLENNIFTNNYIAIEGINAESVIVAENQINGSLADEVSFPHGIRLGGGDLHLINNNTIERIYRGIMVNGNMFASVMNPTIQYNTVQNNLPTAITGIHLSFTEGATLLENNLFDIEDGSGITSIYSVLLSIISNLINNTETGMYLYGSSIPLFEDNSITKSSEWDLELFNTFFATNNLTTDSAYLEGYFEDVNFKDVEKTVDNPVRTKDIGIFYLAESTSASSELGLYIYYDDAVPDDEHTLLAWKYDAPNWELLIDSYVNTTEDYVYTGTIDSFSIIGLMEFWDEEPEITLGLPEDLAVLTTSTVRFGLKCSDDVELSTLQIWSNISGNWSLTATYSGIPPNDTWWNHSVYSVSNGDYLWGGYCEDDFEQGVWSDNRTFTVNRTGGGGGGGTPSESDPEPIVCCEYSCLLGDCSYGVMVSSQCFMLGGTETEHSMCEGLPGAETLPSSPPSSDSDISSFITDNLWIVLLIGAVIIFIIIKKKNK